MERKRVAEVAEQVYQKLLNPKTSLDYSDPTIVIAKFLESYANERLEEAAKVCDGLSSQLDEKSADKVFSVKFKQAIKGMNGSVVAEECAVRVRALKSKEPGK